MENIRVVVKVVWATFTQLIILQSFLHVKKNNHFSANIGYAQDKPIGQNNGGSGGLGDP